MRVVPQNMRYTDTEKQGRLSKFHQKQALKLVFQARAKDYTHTYTH